MPQHSTWPDRLKWAEEQGLSNLQEKSTTGDNVNGEAQTTLTYVLTGLGATFAYSLAALSKSVSVALFVSIVLCVYFSVLGMFLVFRTQFIGEFPSPFQEPKNLIKDEDVSIDIVRRAELENIGNRIDEATSWIQRKAYAVNLVRAALVLSPLVAVIAFVTYENCGAELTQKLVNWLAIA